MDFTLNTINWFAIPVAAIASMMVGRLWYSPVIAANAWMQESGFTEEDIKNRNPKEPIIKAFIGALVSAFGVAILLGQPQFAAISVIDGVIVGLFMAVFFVGATMYCNYAFESKSNRHFMIHLGNHAVSLMVMSAIISAWR